ncbi:similar to Saccharomyces cerevisiae YER136W GDI1 GDP dissociation inhibitor [Geotrichum candidum]|uniref:Rab GDP dissociation inhibitor n=1 Tax=Geotrichum candidum TaxID=1173061 RepID=A0A0J9XEC3_GEOCN|nr:similar to Saccharomyces cerevisiae YER136W GDI1 GDP dissociation inhibitor [Geotrichum candidum]
MDEEYDVIVLGTGLTECILSGIMSVEGKKVLHIDRQDHYGAESASLNLTQLYKKFRPSQKPAEALGKDRDWNVDLIPKFIMAGGELTKILTETAVLPYLEFTQISGSYVYRDGRIAKVPSTQMEAIKSSLMGIFEKRRARNFFEFIGNFKKDDVSTHQGLNLERNTMTEVYLKFGLEPGTRDFIGHAMALWTTDDYLQKPALETIERIIMYLHSVARYGKSPYIYPLYGLGELPQAFARMSAVHGGTYMLNKPVDGLVYGEDGKVTGVKSGDEVAKAPIVIGDPTYFPDKVRKTGQRVIRAMCILNHPVPNTDNLDSLQLIIPQNQLKRKNDIYVAVLSSSHFVCPKGHYIAIISTVIETDQPHVEIEPAFKLLGPREDTLMGIAELYEPIADGTSDNVYISKSYDATSHFETTTDDVKDLYFRITGKPLELKKEEE